MSFDDRVLRDESTGLVLDLTDSPAPDLTGMPAALRAMERLEAGAIANPDEDRRVGHYWLRSPELAPEAELRTAIRDLWARVRQLGPAKGQDLLLVGIGGSALGPQLVADALFRPGDPARLHFLDNTDPDGFKRVFARLDPRRTRVLVVSKSGGTVETRNGMLATMAWMSAAGVSFPERAVAITGQGSRLDRISRGRVDEDADVQDILGKDPSAWVARFPLWDWVGGRTSVTGAVGLVPMALCGWDWPALLEGARDCDAATRRPPPDNPAAWLAGAWYAAGRGRGDRALVVEPYRDRLQLLSRYLQQLIMESLGKRLNRRGRVVQQGLAVYGNKGSTDQHAFMQQIRDGRDDAFVHFVETTAHGPLTSGDADHPSADHLLGFQLGTRAALADSGRPSLSIRVPDCSARSLGVLIALFERAVGLYAELIDVNAYHQPGVEAGKRAAKQTLSLLRALEAALDHHPRTTHELIQALSGDSTHRSDPVTIWRLLVHLAATDRATRKRGDSPGEDRFSNA